MRAARRFGLGSDGSSPGLSCSSGGLFLAGVPLLRKTNSGLAPRSSAEIAVLLRAAYGDASGTDATMRGLSVTASALNSGDLSRAMIAALHLRLPELGNEERARITSANEVLAKYDPDEPRDWHGRWTTGDTGPPRPSGHDGVAQDLSVQAPPSALSASNDSARTNPKPGKGHKAPKRARYPRMVLSPPKCPEKRIRTTSSRMSLIGACCTIKWCNNTPPICALSGRQFRLK